MDFGAIDAKLVTTLLLLMLIGLGPKIALVPFLEKTKKMDAEKQREVGTRMVKTAVVTALVLFVTGAVLMKLLHISGGAVAVAGGLVLILLALKMAAGPDHEPEEEHETPLDHHQIAVYPLAIPYLLNPVGVTVLLVASAKVEDALGWALMIGLILLIGAFDMLVFRNADKLSKRLNPTSLIISEIVFGILLTALGVELIVRGLDVMGVIEAAAAAH